MIEQGSPEWFAARAGKITASRMEDVMAFGKRDGKPLKARQDYIGEIIAEILTGIPRKQIKAKPLEWGKDVEDAARNAYAAETGELVQRAEFVTHPDYPFIGCSPDGMVGFDGLVQIKCPENPVNHLAARKEMPEEHAPQVQGELFVTGSLWTDFVSFDPRMPAHRRLFVHRVHRDDAYIDKLSEACVSLWDEVQEILKEVA